MLKAFTRYILAATLFMTACKKDEAAHESGVPMTLSGFIPATGGHGTSILINGSNFSYDTSEVEVTINGKKLAIIGSNLNQIMAVVPKRCGSGKVIVKIAGKEVMSGGEFNYIFSRTVTTFAGNGTAGYANGKGEDAMFNFNGVDWYRGGGIAIDKAGNVYVTDVGNYCIRKIDPSGMVTTFAGTNSQGDADGTGQQARFNLLYGLAIDNDGNIFTADPGTWKIKKVTPQGVVSTWHSASSDPWHVGVNKLTNEVFYSCTGSGSVYRIPAQGTQETVATGITYPAGLGFDSKGNLFVVSSGNQVIYKFVKDTWAKSIFAGTENVAGYANGLATAAKFANAWGLAVDGEDNLLVAGNGTWNGVDNADQSIRFIDGKTGAVSTYAGSSTYGYMNALNESASFRGPLGVATDDNGISYVIDKNNNRIRKIVSE